MRSYLIAVLLLSITNAYCSEALNIYNQNIHNIWSKLIPDVKEKIRIEAEKIKHRDMGDDVEIVKIRSFNFKINNSPGVTQMDGKGISILAPLSGKWEIKLQVQLKIKKGIFTFNPSVTLKIKNLRLLVGLGIDSSDETHPVLENVNKPNIKFDIEVSSSGLLYNLLFQLANGRLNEEVHKMLDKSFTNLLTGFAVYNGVPQIIAEGSPELLEETEGQIPFRTIINNIDKKIRKYHLTNGILSDVTVDKDSYTTWFEAFGPNGTGSEIGKILDSPGGDGPFWTGHYLVSQAYRYQLTGEAEAIENIKVGLKGLSRMLDINDGSGLLAARVYPLNSVRGQGLVESNTVQAIRVLDDGQEWVGYKGAVSRDQYLGVFFGYANVYDRVENLEIKQECAKRIKQMLGYLIKTNWYIDEDRNRIYDEDPEAPTFWSEGTMKVTFLLIGLNMFPNNEIYKMELEKASKATGLGWVALWITTFNQITGYYKFNLSFVEFHEYFRLETDHERYKNIYRSYKILERATAHHLNPFYDAIKVASFSEKRERLAPSIREMIKSFLVGTNHRKVPPSDLDFSDVKFVKFNVAGFDSEDRAALFASKPLKIPLRHYSSVFQWQEAPFKASLQHTGAYPKIERPGIDATVPYWMGVYHKIF